MVWHIFKKDWKLLWIFVVAVASLHGIAELIIFKLGLFGEEPTLEMLSHAVPILAFFGSAFLTIAIVHLEAIPGVRQDWLARPIRRPDLLLEKFVFVVLTVEGPVFGVNLLEGLTNGFSFQQSLLAAASRLLFLLFFMVLPIFILASVTQNMTEAFIFGCGCTFIIGAFLTLAEYFNGATHGILIVVPHSGIGWIGEVFRFALVALAAVVILKLQYFRRQSVTSRFLLIVFGLLLLGSMFLPWKPVYAIQQRLSPKAGAAAITMVAFDPQVGRYRPASGVDASSVTGPRRGEDNTDVFLPLQITGIHNDTILLTDRVEALVMGSQGGLLYHGNGDSLYVDRPGLTRTEGPIYQRLAVPVGVYRRFKDEPVRVEINYSLTLFVLSKAYSMAALGGDERMPGFGWCETRMNEAETAVELRCMQPGKGPTCATLFLENASTGARNPARSGCGSDYTPYGDRPFPDNITHFGGNIPFRDTSGLAKFPVDGPQLPQSRVVIRVYQPEDHFTRSLTIPEIRLKDWEAQ
jgi:hypothetical protein